MQGTRARLTIQTARGKPPDSNEGMQTPFRQNLKIKTFLGTSANAVMTQVWVALCLYLILAFIRFIPKTVHSMREILNWIRIILFSNEILDDYLIPKMTEPIVNSQLALF